MSDAAPPDSAFVVGEADGIGFAVPMDRVRRLVGAADLPARHRRVSLPRLFGIGVPGAGRAKDVEGTSATEATEATDARYAEVEAPGPGTYLALGADVDVRRMAADAVEPVPPVLATTARRWGWAGVLHDGADFRVVVDVAWLAGLAAPRGGA